MLPLPFNLQTVFHHPFVGDSQLSKHFTYICAASTLLDPRFKKLAISSSSAIERAVSRIQGELSDLSFPQSSPNTEEQQEDLSQQASSGDLWGMFDERVAQASSQRTSSTEVIVQTDRYFRESNIAR